MDLNKIVSSLAGSGVLGGVAGGALGGALVSNKKARKTAGTLLKVGGLAALGGVAWKAYQNYQDGAANNPDPNAVIPSATSAASGSGTQRYSNAPETELPHSPQQLQRWQGLTEQRFALDDQDDRSESPALLIVRAMVAAACADGHLDQQERSTILSRVNEMSLSDEEKAMVFDALESPPSLAELCQRIDSPEVAAEVYLASVLAIDTDRLEARMYLDALAFRLGLPPGMVAQMEHGLEQELARNVA